MWSLFLHVIGVEPRTASTAYNFWSGFGSDIGEATVPAGIALYFWHHNCHEKGCWRIGRLTTVEENGHQFHRCRRHHQIRHEEIGLKQ